MSETADLARAPDGVANPDWVAARAAALPALGATPKGGEPELAASELRRQGIQLALAAKLLNAHMRNRVQLMQSEPTDLTGLPQDQASLLIRAMIAAGHADGGLNEEERARLLALARSGIEDAALRDALFSELDAPPSVERLARLVETPAMAERFYAVSVAVAGLEQPANRAYLAYLAARLAIASDVVLRINREAAGPRQRVNRPRG